MSEVTNDSTARVLRTGMLACVSGMLVACSGALDAVRPTPTVSSAGRETSFTSIVSGPTASHTCGVGGSGIAYCWGASFYEQLGRARGAGYGVPGAVQSSAQFSVIAVGGRSTCALRIDGTTDCWGNNASGQLGIGSFNSQPVPVSVAGGRAMTVLGTGDDHTCAAYRDYASGGPNPEVINSTLYCWGNNAAGQLGIGYELLAQPLPKPLFQMLKPVLLSSGEYKNFIVYGQPQIRAIATGARFTCVLLGTTSGRIQCWGSNDYGQLGNGVTTQRYVPTDVSVRYAGQQFVAVTAGETHACAIDLAGDAYCWGRNDGGQLGNGNTLDQLVMTKAAMPNGAAVTAIAVGSGHTCAIGSDRAAYCWGYNSSGQLGNGTQGQDTEVRIPTRVSSSVAFATVTAGRSHTCALDTTGKPYCWGNNNSLQLGTGDSQNRTVPTAVSLP